MTQFNKWTNLVLKVIAARFIGTNAECDRTPKIEGKREQENTYLVSKTVLIQGNFLRGAQEHIASSTYFTAVYNL